MTRANRTATTGNGKMRRWALAASALTMTAVITSGCSWQGLNSLPLPGAEGTSGDAFDVTIYMPDVTTLTRNSPVRIGDVEVGSIKEITAEDYTAKVVVSLNGDVQMPANSWAKIGQTSLLGSQHLELIPPPEEKPTGTLAAGDVIPLEHAGTYPTTEQTLAALSVVLTNGGLAQFEDIVRELNAALDDGRVADAKEVIGQLNDAISSLDDQKDSIVTAMEGLDRLTGTVADQNDTLAKALTEMPEATRILKDQREQLSGALVSLGDVGSKAGTLAQLTGPDLVANLQDLEPTLTQLADTGQNLTRVLSILITFPFPQAGMDNFMRGDFANLYIDADATNSRLGETFLLGTPLGNRMSGLEGIVGMAPAPNSNADPFALEQHYADQGEPPADDPADNGDADNGDADNGADAEQTPSEGAPR